ncbi:MAG: hypothetical protein P4L16_00185 [Chlamydiales bacterium]|nr:hypothetical protein [Chlamydiales bacterium]
MRIEDCFVPNNLGSLSVFYENEEFFIETTDGKRAIQKCDLSKELKNISEPALSALLSKGQLCVIHKQVQELVFDNAKAFAVQRS